MAVQTAGTTRLGRLARFTARYRWPAVGAWIVLTLFGGFAAGQLSSRWYQSLAVPGKPAYAASQRTLEAFGVGVRAPNVVVFHAGGDVTKSVAIMHAIRRAAASMPGARTSSSPPAAACMCRVTGTRPSRWSTRRGEPGSTS